MSSTLKVRFAEGDWAALVNATLPSSTVTSAPGSPLASDDPTTSASSGSESADTCGSFPRQLRSEVSSTSPQDARYLRSETAFQGLGLTCLRDQRGPLLACAGGLGRPCSAECCGHHPQADGVPRMLPSARSSSESAASPSKSVRIRRARSSMGPSPHVSGTPEGPRSGLSSPDGWRSECSPRPPAELSMDSLAFSGGQRLSAESEPSKGCWELFLESPSDPNSHKCSAGNPPLASQQCRPQHYAGHSMNSGNGQSAKGSPGHASSGPRPFPGVHQAPRTVGLASAVAGAEPVAPQRASGTAPVGLPAPVPSPLDAHLRPTAHGPASPGISWAHAGASASAYGVADPCAQHLIAAAGSIPAHPSVVGTPTTPQSPAIATQTGSLWRSSSVPCPVGTELFRGRAECSSGLSPSEEGQEQGEEDAVGGGIGVRGREWEFTGEGAGKGQGHSQPLSHSHQVPQSQRRVPKSFLEQERGQAGLPLPPPYEQGAEQTLQRQEGSSSMGRSVSKAQQHRHMQCSGGDSSPGRGRAEQKADGAWATAGTDREGVRGQERRGRKGVGMHGEGKGRKQKPETTKGLKKSRSYLERGTKVAWFEKGQEQGERSEQERAANDVMQQHEEGGKSKSDSRSKLGNCISRLLSPRWSHIEKGCAESMAAQGRGMKSSSRPNAAAPGLGRSPWETEEQQQQASAGVGQRAHHLNLCMPQHLSGVPESPTEGEATFSPRSVELSPAPPPSPCARSGQLSPELQDSGSIEVVPDKLVLPQVRSFSQKEKNGDPGKAPPLAQQMHPELQHGTVLKAKSFAVSEMQKGPPSIGLKGQQSPATGAVNSRKGLVKSVSLGGPRVPRGSVEKAPSRSGRKGEGSTHGDACDASDPRPEEGWLPSIPKLLSPRGKHDPCPAAATGSSSSLATPANDRRPGGGADCSPRGTPNKWSARGVGGVSPKPARSMSKSSSGGDSAPATTVLKEGSQEVHSGVVGGKGEGGLEDGETEFSFRRAYAHKKKDEQTRHEQQHSEQPQGRGQFEQRLAQNVTLGFGSFDVGGAWLDFSLEAQNPTAQATRPAAGSAAPASAAAGPAAAPCVLFPDDASAHTSSENESAGTSCSEREDGSLAQARRRRGKARGALPPIPRGAPLHDNGGAAQTPESGPHAQSPGLALPSHSPPPAANSTEFGHPEGHRSFSRAQTLPHCSRTEREEGSLEGAPVGSVVLRRGNGEESQGIVLRGEGASPAPENGHHWGSQVSQGTWGTPPYSAVLPSSNGFTDTLTSHHSGVMAVPGGNVVPSGGLLRASGPFLPSASGGGMAAAGCMGTGAVGPSHGPSGGGHGASEEVEAWFRLSLFDWGIAFFAFELETLRVLKCCPLFSSNLGWDSPAQVLGQGLVSFLSPAAFAELPSMLVNPMPRPLALLHKCRSTVPAFVSFRAAYPCHGQTGLHVFGAMVHFGS